MSQFASDRMKRLAASPGHPAQGEQANERRRHTRKEQRQAELAWEREHPEQTDRLHFTAEVLPLLQRTSAREIAKLTGMSVSYCVAIRRGERVPPPRWWKQLSRTVAD